MAPPIAGNSESVMDIDTRTEQYDVSRQPSFVDLRHFARSETGKVVDRADFLGSRYALAVDGEDGPVGLIALDQGDGTIAKMPNDEFVIVLQGALRLSGKEGDLVLAEGDAAVLAQGSAFQWTADEATVAIYMRYAESKSGSGQITPIRKEPPLEPSNKPAADILIGPAPDCRNFNDYRVDDGRFVCGTWDSTPYRRHAFLYGHYEIMHLVQGSLTLNDDAGREQQFNQGDVILAEYGSRCAWDSREHVAKVFAIYRKG